MGNKDIRRNIRKRRYIERGYGLFRVLAAFLIMATMGIAVTAAPENPTVVRVDKNKTLNEAIADVEGPIKVILPEGVTKHDDVITRRATVIIEGQGEGRSTLRATDGVPLIAQKGIKEKNAFDGGVRIANLTYDRAHQPGWSFDPRIDSGEKRRRQGPTILSTSAGGRVVFENVTIYHFDFGKGPGNGQGQLLQGLGTPQYKWNSPDMPRHEYVGFHNVTIDFKRDGGVRHRHNSGIGGPAIAFAADKLVFDEDSLIQGHLTQHADPAHTVGEPPSGRGNAGALSAFKFNVWNKALIAGTVREIDYSVVRKGLMQDEDATVKLTGNFPECGFGDQTWIGTQVGGGRVVYEDAKLTSAEDSPWHDRGFKVGEAGDHPVGEVRVDGCRIIGRSAPVQANARKVTVRDTVIRGGGIGGDRAAIILSSAVERFDLINTKVGSNTEFTPPQLYGYAIMAPGNKEAQIRLEEVDAEVVYGLFKGKEKGTVERTGVRVKQATYPPLLEGTEIGLLPRQGFGFGLRGKHAGRPPVPGTFRFPADRVKNPGIPFTAVSGNPNLDPDKEGGGVYGHGAIAYDDKHLRLWLMTRFDRGFTRVNGAGLSGATRLRIGVAEGVPGETDEWYEIDVASTDQKVGTWGSHPKYATPVEVRRYPGGNVVDVDLEASTGQFNTVRNFLVAVPWQELNINPSDGRVSLDLAYIDVENGEREGVWALGGKTGLLGERSTKNYKNTALLYYDEMARLKAWFEEKRQNRSNQ